MKSYAQMTTGELESALRSLQATVPPGAGLPPSSPAMAEPQPLRSALKACQIELEMQTRELRKTQQQLAATRAFSSALLDANPDLMFRISRDGTYLDFRAERDQELVLPPDAIIGTKIEQAPLPPLVKELAMRHIHLALETGQPQSFEYTLLLSRGQRYFDCRLARSGPHEVVSLVRDITQRKQAEGALRESEDHYRDLVEHSQDLLSIHDLEGRILSLNQGAAARLGYEPSELVNKHIRDILVPEASENLERYLEIIRRDGVAHGVMRVLTKTGERRIWEYHNTLRTEGVATPVVRGTAHDVTERKRVEQALRHAEEKYRSIFENAIEGIAQSTPDGPFITVNPALARMLGYQSPQEMLAEVRLAEQLYVELARRAEFKRLIEERGLVQNFESELYRKDGSRIWVSVNARAIRDSQGHLLYYEGSLEDITARKQAEEQLREQAALLNHAQDAIMVRDLNGRIIFWNKGAERLYGWTVAEATGLKVRDLLYQGAAARFEIVQERLLTDGEWRGEMRQFTKEGQELTVDSHWTLVRDDCGQPKSVLVINTDITEKKKLESQFLRVQRLESVGTLAGGIAHDLNNVFAPILMAIKILHLKFTDEKSHQLLGILQTNTERGAHMIKQVLAFARGAQNERITLSPKHLIKEIVKILGETLPKSIRIVYAVPEDLWSVTGDATQIYQVLMNLCLNARDALPEGGQLKIAAENRPLDEAAARQHQDAKPGPYVIITVADTGIGMPPLVMGKIFEPFFTTKEPGRGTGLGLSTALSLVRGHGGFITVTSALGQGTQFQLHLPAVGAAQSAPGIAVDLAPPRGRGETILVVDDEAAFRQVAQETLETFGYHVITCSNGNEAVTLYAQHSGRIQAVLADLMMPSMSGATLIQALREVNPRVRLIASSGLSIDNKLAAAIQAESTAFLPKPYTADQLLKTLAEVLEAEEPEHKSAAQGKQT